MQDELKELGDDTFNMHADADALEKQIKNSKLAMSQEKTTH